MRSRRLDAPGPRRIISQSTGPGSQDAAATTSQARQVGKTNARRLSSPRTIPRTTRSVGSLGGHDGGLAAPRLAASENSLTVRPGQAAQTRTPVPASS